MAYSIPDGTIIKLGTTFGAPLTVSAISNANPAVVTAAAHGLSDGDIVVLSSGWSAINDCIYRVDNSDTDSFELEGLDTTDTGRYPTGSGAGSVREVTAWTQVTQVLGLSTSGGEQQYATAAPLELDIEIQIPTNTSAQSIQIQLGDDPSLDGYKALKKASESRAVRPLEMLNKNGSKIYYNGYVSLNETPTKAKGQVDVINASLALVNKPVRYDS